MGTLPRLDAKVLYRRLDSLLGGLDPTLSPKQVLPAFLEDAFRTLKDDLRLKAAALYFEQRDGFGLVRQVGEPGGPLADVIDPARPPLTLVFQHRLYIFSDPLSETSPAAAGLMPLGPSAALVVGRRPNRHVFFFLMTEGWIREELDFALNTLRAALGARLMEERLRGSFREAAEIQQSLLVEEPPSFPGFELAARSLAADEVGGDFYDFFSFDDDEMLGLAIGDASGHGLPAALLVRDVVTGLRMGIEKHLKVAHAFAKLNRVIHRSNLSSRFVSLFYGELEADGNLVYVNAGHQPPILFSAGKAIELRTGGTVIGPLPEAQFRRGIAYLSPGDVLVLCTDGILERRDSQGAFFGDDRLQRIVEAGSGRGAEEILVRIFEAATEFGQGRAWEDDATAVVVRRLNGVSAPPL